MKYTIFSIFILLVFLQLTAANNATEERIDPRYPNYIVDPPLNCPEEGSFPHPRNCSWFYRCHDFIGRGVFHKFYFECAPGTVFSDELDVCVHPRSGKDKCPGSGGENGEGGSGVGGSGEAGSGEVGSGETGAGEGGPGGGAGSNNVEEKVDPDDECYDFLTKCKEYMCPTLFGRARSIGIICEEAYKECSNGTKTNFCQQGLFYNIQAAKCVENPVNSGCTAVEDSSEVEEIPTTTTSTTTTPAPINPENCYDTLKGCANYKCEDDTEYLCRSASRTCNFNEVTFFCLDTQYYNFDSQECVEDPVERGCKPEEQEDEKEGSESINISFYVECSSSDPRPQNEKFKEYFCKEYESCTRFTRSEVSLCKSYLQCYRDAGKWGVKVVECEDDTLFDYSKDRCIPDPRDSCDRTRF